jgi:dTDP-4-amino-4,6-dideoxygalactose transaminase
VPTSSLRSIPLLDLAPQNGPLREEILAALLRVIDSNRFILGGDVEALEREVAAYLRVPHAVGCASGSDALFLALLACGIGSGDEVLVPPFTFFATAGAVTRVGATPVFADIDPLTFNLDPRKAREAADRHPRIKALIPVHLFGGAADMDPLIALARERGWAVIEDGAQSIGAEYNGRRVMSLGDIGCLSFFPSKNLGAFGDAGMLTALDPEIARRLSALRVHGSFEKYRHEWAGVNSRLDTLQAAVLRVKLPRLDEWTEGRQRNAALLTALLEGLPVTPPRPAPYQTRHVFNQYVIRAPRRDELKQFLASRGVGTEIYYPVPLHLQPCYRGLGIGEGALPESERAAREVLALPVHAGLQPGDVEYVAEQIRAFYSA